MAAQILGIGSQLRQYLLLHDRAGDVPRRIKQDITYRRLKLGGLLVSFTDDDTRCEHRPVVAEQLKSRNRGIYNHAVGWNDPRQPAQPLEIYGQLPGPAFRCCTAIVRCRSKTYRTLRGSPRAAAISDRAVFGIGAAQRR